MNRFRYSNGDPVDFPPPPPPLQDISPSAYNYLNNDCFPPPPPPSHSGTTIISSSNAFQQPQHSTQLRSAPKYSPPKPLPLSPKPLILPGQLQSHQAMVNHQASPSPSPSSSSQHVLQRNLSRASDRSSLSMNLEDLSRALTFLDNATLELELFSQLSPNSLLFQDGEPLFTSEEIEKVHFFLALQQRAFVLITCGHKLA